jgi:Clp amino terminal domain, pathogenicity island component
MAQEEARALQHNYIGTEHILLGLLREEEGLAARVLESLAITVESVRDEVVRIVGRGEEVTSGQIPFTPRAKKVLELALREALSLGHNYIGTEHVLLGLVTENDGVAARILYDFEADPEAVRGAVIRMLSGPVGPLAESPMATSSTRAESPHVIDRAWVGGLGVVLDDLSGKIRRERQRAPDTGDLLLVLAGAPDTLAGRALRELGANLEGLPVLVQRLRAQAFADDELAQQIQELTETKQQAVETLARLRAQERQLREQAEARGAIRPEALQEIYKQLGIPAPGNTLPPPDTTPLP